MQLPSFLRQKDFFSEEECEAIAGAFVSEVIPKGTVITSFGQYAQKILFLESGLIRTFFLNDGKDITHFFFDEDCFMAPIMSIINRGQAERYQWEALEACKVSVIPFEVFLELEDSYPRLSRLTLEFSFYLLDLFSQKLNMLQFQSAAERYDSFLEMYPNLTNRVSLGDTASFLGITQQTLSVIRGKKK